MDTILITGCCGLIGSETSIYFSQKGFRIHGIDNNQREAFFGRSATTDWNLKRLTNEIRGFVHHSIDIRQRDLVEEVVRKTQPKAVIHCAGQPSHDLAASIPFEDFEINATGTLNLLEAVRRHSPEAPFVFLSTNKVYGDAPNHLALTEKATRWDYADETYQNGIPETFSVDQSLHSLFGASKLAADILVQEYGRYFEMPTCSLRCGCLSGPHHSAVELHGFLSYLVKCSLKGDRYRVIGYRGKQVRDNIHSLDVARFIDRFIESPRTAAVYNIGGGVKNSCSILEALTMIYDLTGRQPVTEFDDTPRKGDHICYYSDLRRAKSDYPGWNVEIALTDIIADIAAGWEKRLNLGNDQ